MTTLRTAPQAPVDAVERSTPLAAVLAWLVPGAGHWYLGYRDRAVVFFVVITVTFWGGVALGGVRSTVNAGENRPWLAAQLCAGPQTFAALMWGKSLPRPSASAPSYDRYEASYPASDISVVYAGIAGLLNLLVIIDALARSESPPAAQGARSPPSGSRG